MADLKTDYKNNVVDLNTNETRKYRMITNDDGTVSFEDVTVYSQVGNDFGAEDINAVTQELNQLETSKFGDFEYVSKTDSTSIYWRVTPTSDNVVYGISVDSDGGQMVRWCSDHGVVTELGITGLSAYELAVEEGYEGTLEEWLASLQGTSGSTPYIGDNGNWFIDDEDTGVPASGGGGGGGGGGTSNNAVLTTTNTTGWLAISLAIDQDCILKANWSSLEDGLATGAGTAKVRVNGSIKATQNINQGDISINIKDYLSTGTNTVKLIISDVYGNTKTINFTVTVIAISISSTFDTSLVYSSAITFPYTPVGSVAKTIHFILDGNEIAQTTTSVSGRQQTYVIPAQKHGNHTLKVYFSCLIDGTELNSNELYFDITCIEANNMTPIISSNYIVGETMQYTSLPITYKVYNPANISTEVKMYANDTLVSTQTVDRTTQTWTYKALNVGENTLRIEVETDYGTASKTWTFNVTEVKLDVEAETDSLSLYLSSYGRSNNEDNPGEWKYNNISATFTDFNFSSDGWQLDSDNITALRVAGDARLTIPVQPFKEDFRTTGKTIEIEFSTSEIMDYDAIILNCMSGDRGIELTAQKATIKSEQSTITTQYKEDEHVRISFVVEKRSENRLIYCYINGVMSGVVQYPIDDDFAQQTPVNISIGSNDCVCNLYCIRIYDNDLTRQQILNNWIADTQNIDNLLYRYEHNNIFDDYGSIVISNLPNDLPYIVLQADELPQYKGDKKTITGYYIDPSGTTQDFEFENCQADVQGTSSAGYERKNYKLKFKGGFKYSDGTTSDGYSMRSDSIPTATFTFKADVASSEGCNNVELVRLYNDICPYQTPAQKADPRIRQGIDGFPIVLFWDNGTDVTFMGKYNFNNDKGTEEVYGFTEGDESWEILNNTSSRVNWKSADFTGTDWLNDFEGRYPDGNEDPTKLAELAKWLVSTDTSAATNEVISPVTYNDEIYSLDTPEYRLAKFKIELPFKMDLDGVLFNYLFTELFLMVDSRAKNAFPTIFVADNKWTIFPYDFDTAIGINNEGALVFDYSLEDIDTVDGAMVFNGQESVLYKNIRSCFQSELASMYQTLRSSGSLSYDTVEQMFENHQNKWSEAIFNEDAWFKYLAPLVEKGNSAYLAMLQGSKAEQRKWWLYNRFRYMDSKYNAGDALSDFIMIRAYAKDDISVTPYADIYATVKYGSYTVQSRANRGKTYTLACPLDTFNDTECYIYSSSQLRSVGDLSGLKVGYADFSKATRLQDLKLGDSADSYSNPNLKELYLGNNKLLRTIDVRNCGNLTQTVDLSGCNNLEEVYFNGTQVTGINLPQGGIMKKLYLPVTLTNLTVVNQPKLEDMTFVGNTNDLVLSTLRLENSLATTEVTDGARAYLANMLLQFKKNGNIADNARIRLIGFYHDFEDTDTALAFFTWLDGMRGLDENGNTLDNAQISGTIHIPDLTGAQLANIQARYPSVNVTYDNIISYCYFYTWDGGTLLYTATCKNGADAVYSGSNPSRSSTAQYNYTFAGWSKTSGGSAQSNALTNVEADRNVYAAYTATIRTYTVYFVNSSSGSDVTLEIVTNVAYGSSATYSGSTPISADGDATDYPFEGWSPSPSNITGNTTCYAVFASPNINGYERIEDSWEDIIIACEDGTYKEKYSVGMYKRLDLGSEGSINMQIAAIDAEPLADDSGTAKISWVSYELLPFYHRMNPALTYIHNFTWGTDKAFIVSSTENTIKIVSKNLELNDTEVFKMAFTPLVDCTVTRSVTIADSEISYQGTASVDGISNEIISDLTCTANTKTESTISVTQTIAPTGSSYESTEDFPSCCRTYLYTFSANFTEIFGEDYSFDTAFEITNPETTVITDCTYSYKEGTGAIGGWEKSEMRSYLKDTVKPLVPEAVRNKIVEVTKTQYGYNTEGSLVQMTSTDDIWIPDYYEIDQYKTGIYRMLFSTGASREKYRCNTSIKTSTSTVQTWVTDSAQTNGYKSNSNYNVDGGIAVADFKITATTAGTLTISYKVSSEADYDKYTLKVNNAIVANAISGLGDWLDYTVECSAGDVVTVKTSYVKDGLTNSNDDRAYVKFSSTGTISIDDSGTIKKITTPSSASGTQRWWTRCGWYNASGFQFVYINGYIYSYMYDISSLYGIALGFCF